MLAYAMDYFLVFLTGQVSDFSPIFFSDILVSFYRSRIQSVAAALLAAGNPILVPSFRIRIICFEASAGKCMEEASLVVQGFTGFGKSDAPDSRRSADFVALALDVNDATFHGSYSKEVYILGVAAPKKLAGMRQTV
jgi:hypothetical protein